MAYRLEVGYLPAVKRKVVMPPKTAEGMATREAANLANIPMMIKKKLQSC